MTEGSSSVLKSMKKHGKLVVRKKIKKKDLLLKIQNQRQLTLVKANIFGLYPI